MALVPNIFGTKEQLQGDNFSTDQGSGWLFWDDSSTLHLLYSLFVI